MKATFITKLDGWRGDARLFQMDPPYHDSEYVVVSGIPNAFDTGQPETYIFKADPEGEVTNWVELEGSFRGALDHSRALKGAGYEMA